MRTPNQTQKADRATADVRASSKQKVVVWVEGGIVQEVFIPVDRKIEVEIVDFDNLEESGYSREDRNTLLEHATEGLTSDWQ